MALTKKPEELNFYDQVNRAVDLFLNNADVKGTTKLNYRKALSYFIGWLRENNREPDRKAILDWRDYLTKCGRAASTVGTYITAVKRLFSWLFAEGIIKVNPAAGIKPPGRRGGFSREALTATQARRLLTVIRRESKKKIKAITTRGEKDGRKRESDVLNTRVIAVRDFALVNLMIRTGLRTIEVHRANVGDIRERTGEMILLVQGKGRDVKDDFVVLTPEAFNPIMDYLHTRDTVKQDEPLFVSHSDRNKGGRLAKFSIRYLVKGYLRAAGVDTPTVTTHSLRHTAVTLALRGGADLAAVQAMARHVSVNTTMIYVHNLDRLENAAEKSIKL